MAIDLSLTPDSFRRRLAPDEKKRLGAAGLCLEELLLKQSFKKETGKGGLQDLIGQFLRLRQIPYYQSRTDKPTREKRGKGDFVCCVAGRFVMFEAKMEGQEPSDAQWAEINAIRAAGGIAVVVYSLDAVKAVIDDLIAQAGKHV